ncbi:NurA domain protein [Methanohalobium evestigatum Z-7303]|uniref:NurA domain protein n=1 Tax=Methanohalobium evestigatum (strain ATCC BAA-1072 / DSM 3721 / NBRC 107634 / OCM 161 / Z-7303) TaxID=644295 RepID=D7EBF8_METEZ|nr:DNA double-strand break repair nuclease NurA [Methanohalobium evestigatum]ADI74675.1 NurA domain protein [Methanohalobium evestigatum Z-7303]
MTLEPVHIKEISQLASNIDVSLEDKDESEITTDIFSYLQELKYKGNIVLKSMEKLYRGKVNVEYIAQSSDPFDITYACDSGSTNPIPFDSGFFVDFCHCALASTPTNLDLHMKRTIVAATYNPSETVTIKTTQGWKEFDDGSGRKKIIRIQPGLLNKRIGRMVHDIALYLAESEHINWMLDGLDDNGVLIMDGPVYPKRLMYWLVVESEDIQIQYDPHTKTILQNYIDIMDEHIKKQKPLMGFVKNPEDIQVMQAMKQNGMRGIPWTMDAQFFKNLLSLKNDDADENKYITYTNWFIQPNKFYERMLNTTSPLVEDTLEHKYPADDYSLTFFMVYVPWMDVIFKIESPYGLTKNENIRDMVKRKVLYDISINGIPKALSKADSIAKIRKSEREYIKQQFNTGIDTSYNDIRWSETDV